MDPVSAFHVYKQALGSQGPSFFNPHDTISFLGEEMHELGMDAGPAWRGALLKAERPWGGCRLRLGAEGRFEW